MAELATRQHGVVSIGQLLELGYSRDAVSHACAAGRLHRIHRGVYAVGHKRIEWHGGCLGAVLACPPGAVASHLSAAWLWGLVRFPPDVVDVTAPTRRHRRPGLRLRYAPLLDEDRGVCDGIPVTSVPRTLLDLAAFLPAHRLNRVLERSEELGLFDLGPVEALLARAGGHHGASRLRRALALYQPPPFTRSGLERRFLELVRRGGLPAPSTCYVVAGHELDCYWEPQRFAVELDVFETHGTRAAFECDRLRQEDLKLAGIEMIRITGHRLDREPDAVIDRLQNLLRRRQAELQPGRAGRSDSYPQVGSGS